MVRPRKRRLVRFEPDVTYFKPRGVPLRKLEEVELTVDELEALRLANIGKMSQSAAAEKMQVHQSTFQRTLASAREKLTVALVKGHAIKIHGGDYKMPGGDGTGPIGRGFRAVGRAMGGGPGRGRMRGPFAAGPGGECVCPSCGKRVAHARGQPCNRLKCPSCGTTMTRG